MRGRLLWVGAATAATGSVRTFKGAYTDVERPPEILDYISKLAITDPVFYEVFSDDEILSFFYPSGPQVPVYSWASEPEFAAVNGQCGAGATGPVAFGRGEVLWRDFIYDYPLKVDKPDRALLHFVPTYTAVAGMGECSAFNATSLAAAYDRIQNSAQFKATNGSNFFAPMSFYVDIMNAQLFDAENWKEGHKPGVPDSSGKIRTFYSQITRLPLVAVGNQQACAVVSSYLPMARFRTLDGWPHGRLESYLYPEGIFAQVNKTRPYSVVFYGQADQRNAYISRRVAFKNIPGLLEPSLIVRGALSNDPCENAKDPICGDLEGILEGKVVTENVTGCCVNVDRQDTRFFPEFTLKGKFSLHMRGDDWSSARIADVIQAQTIPVIIMKQALSLSLWNQCHVPWALFSVFIDLDEFVENPQEALKPLVELAKDPDQMERKLRLLEYYRLKLSYRETDALGMEDAMREVVSQCVREDELRALGHSKVPFHCPFGTFTSVANFPNAADEDIIPPYRS